MSAFFPTGMSPTSPCWVYFHAARVAFCTSRSNAGEWTPQSNVINEVLGIRRTGVA